MSDSKLTYRDNGELASVEGRDAINLLRAAYVKNAIDLYLRTGGRIQITRGWGIMRLLASATTYTGKPYRRADARQASDDLAVWIHDMKMALPKEDQDGEPLI